MHVNNLPRVVTWWCPDLESIPGPFSHQSCLLQLHHHYYLLFTYTAICYVISLVLAKLNYGYMQVKHL